MASERTDILVVGSDSMVGKVLIPCLREGGKNVIGTTRRREVVNENNLFLDLSMDTGDWTAPESAGVAVVLAGVTKILECQKNPRLTRRVNIQGIVDLIDNLASKGIFIIYLSTNQVFDGSKPYRKPEEPLSPITEYGRQKAEVELQIKKNWKDSVSILRATKIFDTEVPLFNEWVESMRAEKVIHPFSDMVLAPITLECTVSALKKLIDKKMPGIFQLSGSRDFSYSEVAYMGADTLNLDRKLIKPIPVKKSAHHTEKLMKHTTLNVDKLRDSTGIEPPASEWVIQRIFRRMDTGKGDR